MVKKGSETRDSGKRRCYQIKAVKVRKTGQKTITNR